MLNTNIAKRVKYLLVRREISQKQFAEMLYISPCYASRLLTGKANWTIDQLMMVKKEFKVSLDWLTEGETK